VEAMGSLQILRRGVWWDFAMGNAVVGEAGLVSHTRLPLRPSTGLR